MPYVTSTAIQHIAWNSGTLVLNITFASGRTYSYCGVPEWKYLGLVAAPSKGEFFNEHIRDQHRC